MKYIVKEKHYKSKKINKKRVCITIIISIAIILFAIFIITKQVKPAEVAEVTENSTNIIVVDKNQPNEQEAKNQNNTENEAKNEVQNQQQANEQSVGQPNEQKNNESNQQISNSQTSTEVKLPTNFSGLTTDELQRFDKIYSHSDPKRIFLTFDDGPTPQVTPYILDLLKNENIKASFFVLGTRVEANPELVKREYEEGHYIANHGYSHKYSSIYQSSNTVLDEYNKTNQAIRNAIGNQQYNSLVFRFPGGSVGGTYDSLKKGTKQILREQGIASVDWNALVGDAEGIKTKEGLYNRFVQTASMYTSVVLLMHDAADKILTYETLPSIIAYCRENGYEFKTMYDVILR